MDPKLIFRRVCKYLDDNNFKYDTDEKDLLIHFGMRGEDIPVKIIIRVDDKRSLLKVVSPMPFDIAEDKRVEAAIAINAINNQLANGNFDMDIGDGTVLFRVAVPFEGGMPDESIHYLIGVACVTVDEYNDKLLMLNKGMWTLEEFIGKI